MKKLLILFVMIASLTGCSKDEKEEIKIYDTIVGNEYLREFNAALNYSIEFTSGNEIKYGTKNRGSNTDNEFHEPKYYKWEKSGISGLTILVTIPKDANFPERKITGHLLDNSITFTEHPLKGAYDLKK